MKKQFTSDYVEAVKLYRCLFEYQSNESTAKVFGCSAPSVYNIMADKWPPTRGTQHKRRRINDV